MSLAIGVTHIPFMSPDCGGPMVDLDTPVIQGTTMHKPTADGRSPRGSPYVQQLPAMTAQEAHATGSQFLCGDTRCFGGMT